MSETREQLITRTWRQRGWHWDIDRIGPELCLEARHPLYPVYAGSTPISELPKIDILRYRYEKSVREGQPYYRVVCEGSVVEEGYA